MADWFAPELAERATREMADDAGAFATATARALAPISPVIDSARAPGTLRRSYEQIDVHPFAHGDGKSGYASGVQSHDFVARLIEYGVAPHDVSAKAGRWLVFRAWPNGEIVRAKLVHQKGFPGQHIVHRAIEATRFAFDEIAEPALLRWVERQSAAAHTGRP
ncbi:MAG TPA: hypothetical protein VG188_01020 [Solirubrobacteraceae bacterium]|nr:hypothetical protein [Solirubrobacteraceae bacterium]